MEQVLSGEFVDYDLALGGFTATQAAGLPVVTFTRTYAEVPLELQTTTEAVSAAFTGVRTSGEDPEQASTPDQLSWAATFQGPGPPWLIDQGWMEFDSRYEWARGGLSVEAALDATDVVVVNEDSRR